MQKDDQDYNDGVQSVLLKGGKVNHSDSNSEAGSNGSSLKKKKIIGGVVIGVAVLALVLGLTLRKKDDDDGGGDGPGPSPFIPVNPYSLVGELNKQTQVFTGVLQIDQEALKRMPEPSKNLRYGNTKNTVSLLDPRIIPTGDNNPILSEITFEIGQSDFKTSYLILSDATKTRYSIPETITPKPRFQQIFRTDQCGLSIETNPFTFTFTDSKDDDNVLVTSKNSHFLMTDKYIQLDLQLPSQRIYGLGERQHEFTIGEGTWTMWANDDVAGYDSGNGGQSSHGVHPFALVQSKQPGQYFGVFFRNSNAQSPIVGYNDDGTSVLSYVTTGGNIEIYFFWKGTAKQIISQYQNFVGRPNLPPFWSLGWHAGSKSYTSLAAIQDNVKAYKDAGIPLEAVWVDSSFAKGGANFKVDTKAYPDLSAFRTTLQATNQKLVLSMNTGLDATSLNDQYIIEGQAGAAFIKSTLFPEGDYEGALVTAGKANQTVFLDLFQSAAADLWGAGLDDLYTQTKFDGLSFIGNEPSSKCNGECQDGVPVPPTPSAKQSRKLSEQFLSSLEEDSGLWYTSYSDQSENSTWKLPFIPYNNTVNLDNATLSLNATHANDATEYDVHSLMGLMQSAATRNFFQSDKSPSIGSRPFIISAGTYSGSGKSAGHSLGPNERSWDNMKNLTAGVMNMNMFGVPFTGPDVCGTFGEANEELCARWIQTSAFYPFARQVSDDAGQEPYSFQDVNNVNMAKSSLMERLRYSRQLYTCLFEAQSGGETCFDPVLFHFPTDDKTFKNTEESFIFANALKISPVLNSGATTVKTYFPAGDWVSMKDYSVLTSAGQKLEVPVQSDVAIAHLMPGAIVTKQMGDFMTTSDLSANLFTMIANRDTNLQASGSLYVDDGVSLNQAYDYHEFQLSAKSFKKWEKGTSANKKSLDSLIITNAADLASTDFACFTSQVDHSVTMLAATYVDTKGAETLTIKTTDGSPIDLGLMKDIHYGTSATDLNLCDIASQYYKVSGDALDLTKVTTKTTLTSLSPKALLPDLELTLTVLASGVVNVHWTYADDKISAPFEVPTDIIQPNKDKVSTDLTLDMFVTITNPAGEGAIGLTIMNGAKTQVFNLNGMILSQYLNVIDTTAVTKKGSKGIMGLFERVSSDLFLADGVYSLWSFDTANPVETGKPPGNNLYGTHPFYMGQASDNTWFGVFTNLAAAQDWWQKTDETGDKRNVGVKTYATGGLGDLYFMMGAGPNEVTMQYHTIVGLPVTIPQWGLGWNQCRWGYNDTDALKAAVQGYADNKIPLDTIWSDIDWMNNYQNFVHDPVNFKDLPEFVDSLHKKDMFYIPIIDAGLAKRTEGYEAYADGVSSNVFIQSSVNGSNEVFTGQVWANDAAFPDFFAENTAGWWKKWLTNFQNEVAFDGLWLDMNEASNFCKGVCYQSQMSTNPVKYKLPYVPTGRDLEEKSISLDALHAGGVTELDAHSLFGTMEVKATHEWFASENKRTMIIERSSFAGMGKFASRWLGDNFSTDEYMGYSVTGIMGHNIMGIPHAGADICGFIGNTNPELCARWHMVGAFYPFSRNHNAWDSVSQEPYQPMFQESYTETGITYFEIMVRAIQIKYSMIRYYYTELTWLTVRGGAFYKPLFFEFPSEAGAYENQELNIMLGSALKLGIQSKATNVNTTDFYFPEGQWCDIFNTVDAATNCITSPAGGQTLSKSTLAYEFYLHLRGGYIVPMQDAKRLMVKVSHDLKKWPVDLHILPICDAKTCEASGRYVNDDGISVDVKGAQNRYTFTYQQPVGGSVTLIVARDQAGSAIDQNDCLDSIQIYNAAALGLDKGIYNVVATLSDKSTVDLEQTDAYEAKSDRLIWTAFDVPKAANLMLIDFITLTPA